MKIVLGLPGVSWPQEAFAAVLESSREHEINIQFSSMPAHNFNNNWATALNLAEIGEAERFVMLHSDNFPEGWWLDKLERERAAGGYSLLSVAVSIKDLRGLYSCGIGDPNNSWSPKKRWAIREAEESLPKTWTVADAGFPDEMMLHNNGCWIADLTDKRFFETDERGYLKAFFDFPCRIYRNAEGKFSTDGESEDWLFSRKLWELGITNTAVTRAIKLHHRGTVDYANYVTDPNHPAMQWFRRDWHTEAKWNKSKESELQPS